MNCKARSLLTHKFVEGGFVQGKNAWIVQINVDGSFSHILVDPETLCRCSGVPDKHGRIIFEGDIVRVDADVKEIFPQVKDGPVRFSRGGFFVGCYDDVLRSFDVIADYRGVFRGEVIGTIYENPELLKEYVDEN